MPRLKLTDFGGAAGASAATPQPGAAPAASSSEAPTSAEVERVRLSSYEEGYKAGWDDAAAKEAEDQGRIGAEFARNLEDLGFTFHEARAHVMQALEPLLTGMVAKVLPRLVADTIGQTVVEELMDLADATADVPIEVLVAPVSRDALEPMLATARTIPIQLVEEPTLAAGQVYLRSGPSERHIDMTQAVDRIGAAIDQLYQLNEKAFQNG